MEFLFITCIFRLPFRYHFFVYCFYCPVSIFVLYEVYVVLDYHKVASSRLSWLVAHFYIFRLFMKGKFDAYVP